MPVSASALPVPFPPRVSAHGAAPVFDAAEEAAPRIVQAIGARVWSADAETGMGPSFAVLEGGPG